VSHQPSAKCEAHYIIIPEKYIFGVFVGDNADKGENEYIWKELEIIKESYAIHSIDLFWFTNVCFGL